MSNAYAFGGAVMTKQTVQSLLQIPIHYYALANWRGFIEVVDLIGGVDLYVESTCSCGTVSLDGLLIL